VSDRDAFRAAQQERRNHGLKARHETREARAVRKQVAEEIALALEALPSLWHTATIGRNAAVAAAREIGSRDSA